MKPTPSIPAAPPVGAAPCLPAVAEGELRDLVRTLRAAGNDDAADALEAIVNRYSNLKPFRSK